MSILPEYRRIIVDFTHTLTTYDNTYTSRKLQEVPSYDTLLLPFDWQTWLGICISLSLVALLIGTSWNAMYSERRDLYWHSLHLSYSIMLQQNILVKWLSTKSQSISITILFWLMLSNVLAMAYRSNLLSLMAIKRLFLCL